MTSHEFTTIRKKINKSQTELSALLGLSTKAVRSYEQGCRGIPPYVEGHLYQLLSILKHYKNELKACWVINQCPPARKKQCSVYKLKAGTLCWMVIGSYCGGKEQVNWREKMKTCHTCNVLVSIKEN